VTDSSFAFKHLNANQLFAKPGISQISLRFFGPIRFALFCLRLFIMMPSAECSSSFMETILVKKTETKKEKLIYLASFGCDKNLVDSELMLGLAASEGWSSTVEPQKADVILVNTCSFINDAREESVDAILELAQHKRRKARLIVAGCLAQRYPKELAKELPEVDHFIGTGELPYLKEILRGVKPERVKVGRPDYLPDADTPRILSTPPYTAFVKISEGCSSACSYCVIPQLRGPQKSRTIDDIAREVERLLAAGAVELNLVGQNLGTYGDDLTDGSDLTALLRHPVIARGNHWVRLLYLYPQRITPALLDAIADSETVLPYFDLPIQHIDSGILKAMHRPDSEKSTRAVIDMIRKRFPGAALRTSLIVGFPGETEKQFARLLDFVREGHFDRLGAFTYSQEEHTAAAAMPDQIPEELKHERLALIMEAQKEVSRARLAALRGKLVEVLVEGISGESEFLIEGRLWSQAPGVDGVTYIVEGEAETGSIAPLRVKDTHDYDIFGRILKRKPKGFKLGPA